MYSQFNTHVLTCDDNVWFNVVRRVSVGIAKAMGRQLSSRLGLVGGTPPPVSTLRASSPCVWSCKKIFLNKIKVSPVLD